MLSALEQLPSHIHNLKFSDLLHALRERGLNEKANRYESDVVVECILRGVSSPLELTIKEVIDLYLTIPDPTFSDGWDNAYRGKAYYGRHL